jgi:hypothetical protein
MTTTHKPKQPATIGLTDVQKIERLPRFGPGLKMNIPLHLWPIYRRVYGLEERRRIQTVSNARRRLLCS